MKTFDASLKHLLEKYPRDWVAFLARCLHQSWPAQAEVIDSDLATVSAAADKVLRIRGARPWLLHVDLQASHDPRLPERMLLYNVLLHHRHRMPVRSLAVLLRPEAERPGLTGRAQLREPDGRRYLSFQFPIIRLWQQPISFFLKGGLGLLPLAPLAEPAGRGLDAIIREMKTRLGEEAEPAEAAELWTAAYVLLGLQYTKAIAKQIMQGVLVMKESVTYQAIVDEGRAEGLVQGKIELLLELGTDQFGPPDPGTVQALREITDKKHLHLLGKRILHVSSWGELLATPRPRTQSRGRKSK